MQAISNQENENLPILNGIVEFLNKFTPYELLQAHLKYNFNKSREENKTIDINVLIGQFKGRFYEMLYEEDTFINKLIQERELYNIHYTPVGKESLFIEHYNKKVMETIKIFCNHIIKSFCLHPDFEANKDRLNIEAFFTKWGNVFNEDSTNIDPETVTHTTLKTNYTEEQLKKLCKALITGKYIVKNTKVNNFVYIFSGKPLGRISKIEWLKSKKQAVWLLDKICLPYSFDTVNSCLESKFKPFDYNDRPKVGYNEIEEILKTLRPINATTPKPL